MIAVKTKVPPRKAVAAPSVPQHEAELYRAVRPLLIISELFVCAPLGIHRQVAPIDGSRTEWLRQAAHLGWCTLVYSCLFVCVYIQYTESSSDLPIFQKPLYFCEFLVYCVHTLLIIVATQRARHKFRQFLCTILDFDRRLVSFHVTPQYGAYAQFLGRHLLLILGHSVGALIISYSLSNGRVQGFLRSTVVYVLPNLILHISLTQYYGLLYAIATGARKLNVLLQAKVIQGQSDRRVLQSHLKEIRLLYSRLELFTRDVNEAFGQSIILVYVGSFANISVNIFLFYKFMASSNGANWTWMMASVVWICMHISKMFLILFYNYCIQNQKNTTALLLNEMNGQSADIEETITHFMLQLMINTRSNVVCGVIVLNMDFITSLLVAISTLFIFLLQYSITFEALTKTHKLTTPNSNAQEKSNDNELSL